MSAPSGTVAPRNTLLFFAIAGTVGFLLDAGVLQILTVFLAVPPLVARIASFFVASVATWRINRRYAFSGGRQDQGPLQEWARYVAASGLGALVNYLAFAMVVVTAGRTPVITTMAVAAGSLAGMVVNFTLYKYVIFRPQR